MSSLFSRKVLISLGRISVQRNVKQFSAFVKDDNSNMKYWEHDYNQNKEKTNKQVGDLISFSKSNYDLEIVWPFIIFE